MSAKASVTAHRRAVHRKGSRRKRRRRESSPDQIPKNVLRAFALTLCIGLGMILACSVVAYFLPDPLSAIPPLSYLAMGVTALAGGWIAGKLQGGAPLIVGLINGMLLIAAALIVSLFFRSLSSGYSAPFSALLHAAVPLLSFAGALIGTKRTG